MMLLTKDSDDEFYWSQGMMFFNILFLIALYLTKDFTILSTAILVLSVETYGVPLYLQLVLALPISTAFAFIWKYYKSKRKKNTWDFLKEFSLVIVYPFSIGILTLYVASISILR